MSLAWFYATDSLWCLLLIWSCLTWSITWTFFFIFTHIFYMFGHWLWRYSKIYESYCSRHHLLILKTTDLTKLNRFCHRLSCISGLTSTFQNSSLREQYKFSVRLSCLRLKLLKCIGQCQLPKIKFLLFVSELVICFKTNHEHSVPCNLGGSNDNYHWSYKYLDIMSSLRVFTEIPQAQTKII